MDIALWIAQILLALLFLAAGGTKLTKSRTEMVDQMEWVEGVSDSAFKAIGAVEVLGALGLILPAVTGIAPVLVPLAAVGLALTMIGAIALHTRRGETRNALMNLIPLAIAIFVAWGRFGDYAF